MAVANGLAHFWELKCSSYLPRKLSGPIHWLSHALRNGENLEDLRRNWEESMQYLFARLPLRKNRLLALAGSGVGPERYFRPIV